MAATVFVTRASFPVRRSVGSVEVCHGTLPSYSAEVGPIPSWELVESVDREELCVRGCLGSPSHECESACKPDPVEDDHLSGVAVTERPRATYPEHIGRAALYLFGLAPDGVYLAAPVTRCAGGLLPHRFTLACAGRSKGSSRHRRFALCCTVHRVAPPGCYPASCPGESGLSSTTEVAAIVSPARISKCRRLLIMEAGRLLEGPRHRAYPRRAFASTAPADPKRSAVMPKKRMAIGRKSVPVEIETTARPK